MFNEPSVKPDIPATAGTHLVKSGMKLCAEAQTRYHSGVGKLLYLIKWSHPEIVNSVCKLTCFMTEAFQNSKKGMERVMQHVLSFPKHGVVMQPEGHWDGSKDFQFEIDGISDSGNATELESHKWCGGLLVFLNKAPIAHKSKMQPSVLLSMAEGKLIAAVEAVQIMLFTMRVLEDIRLCIKKLMILRVDCKGALDLTYGWNVSGLTKHVSVRACFLHELKEANQILCIWILTAVNMVDMYMKNVSQ